MTLLNFKTLAPKNSYDVACLISSILFAVFLFAQFAVPLMFSRLNDIVVVGGGIFFVGTIYFYAKARRLSKDATHLGLLVIVAAVLDFLLIGVWVNFGIVTAFAFVSAVTGLFLAFLAVLAFIDQLLKSAVRNPTTLTDGK